MPSTEAPTRAGSRRPDVWARSSGPALSRRDGRRTDTRDRLVVSALRMFSERGYARTTVAEIEREVGLRPGSGGLYRHFRSKDDLLLAAVGGYRDRVAALRAEVAAAAEQSEPASLTGDLEQLVLALAGFLAGEGPMVRLSLDGGGLPESVRAVVGEAWDDGYGMLADLLVRHGLAPGAATTVAVSMLGSLDHYFTHLGVWHTRPAGVTPDAFLAAWVEQVAVVAAAVVR